MSLSDRVRIRKRTIRIAFFEARYDCFYGAQRSMYTLVTNLNRTHFKPIMVTTAEGELADRFRKAGIDVHIIPLAHIANVFGKKILRYSWWKKLRILVAILKYNLQVYRWLSSSQVDVVYANDLRALLYAGPAARLRGLPVLWYVRDDQRFGILHDLGVRIATRIITIANGVRKAFTEQELRRYSRKFVTLYTGFDIDQYANLTKARNVIRKELGIPLDSEVIGLVGSITPRKGHDILVEAAPEIVASIPNVHFLIVGDVTEGYEGYKFDLEEKINDLKLSSRFHWVGYRDDIASLYAAMDVLVLPSRSEGLPRTVIEGLAAGLPVIAFDTGGVREIITSEKFGRVIKEKNPNALAIAVIEVLKATCCREEKDKRYFYVLERFSVASYVKGFIKVVEEVLPRARAQ